MKARILLLLLAIATPLSLMAAEPIVIGYAGPQSGDLAPYGIPPKDTILQAAEDLNKKGGILGRKIKIVYQDDVCKPEMAINVAAKLVDQKAVAVIGHICSGATNAALSVYKSAGIPVISPSATLPELTLEGKNPNFFRTIPHDAKQAITIANFVSNKLKAKRVAIVHDKGEYGKGLATYSQAELKNRNIKILLFEGVTPGAVDYSALIRKLKRAKPDVIVFGGYHPEASKIVSQARKKRLKAHFIAGDGVKDPSFLKIGGKFIEGFYASSPSDISNTRITQKLTQQLKAKDQVYGNFGLQAHAAFMALAQAIKQAKSTDAKKVTQALHQVELETTLGLISFDKNGDVQGSGFSVYQVQRGKFQAVDSQ